MRLIIFFISIIFTSEEYKIRFSLLQKTNASSQIHEEHGVHFSEPVLKIDGEMNTVYLKVSSLNYHKLMKDLIFLYCASKENYLSILHQKKITASFSDMDTFMTRSGNKNNETLQCYYNLFCCCKKGLADQLKNIFQKKIKNLISVEIIDVIEFVSSHKESSTVVRSDRLEKPTCSFESIQSVMPNQVADSDSKLQSLQPYILKESSDLTASIDDLKEPGSPSGIMEPPESTEGQKKAPESLGWRLTKGSWNASKAIAYYSAYGSYQMAKFALGSSYQYFLKPLASTIFSKKEKKSILSGKTLPVISEHETVQQSEDVKEHETVQQSEGGKENETVQQSKDEKE
ncbi:hypothetical protein M153_15900012259 [Pseudoloma neurophilia]|uniref:Uncharacterized protein n=1 Tax=Pseudoloma neurophilia TaxID=146866 RepID=A0A0R0LZY2_9MICR|nr:hypothetical protein M153_15900012259 [Pseudoloma neurophilia]